MEKKKIKRDWRKNIRKCEHIFSIQSISTTNHLPYSYCLGCGAIIFKQEHQKNNLIKPRNLQKPTEINPISIFNSMSKNISNKKLFNKTLPTYFEDRTEILNYLQNLCLDFNFTDGTFYQALLFIDTVLCSPIYAEEDISQKEFDLIISSCLVLAAKFSENDIIEPNLTEFGSSNGRTMLNYKELLKYELKMLSILDYNLLRFSTYDWLKFLLYNGIIFSNENKPKIEEVYNYSKSILAMITNGKIFIMYTPKQISFAIVESTRDHYGFSKENFEIMRVLYNYPFDLYENCYHEISEVINEKNRRLKLRQTHSQKKILGSKLTYVRKNKNNPRWKSPPPPKSKGEQIIMRIQREKLFSSVRMMNLKNGINKIEKENRKNTHINFIHGGTGNDTRGSVIGNRTRADSCGDIIFEPEKVTNEKSSLFKGK